MSLTFLFVAVIVPTCLCGLSIWEDISYSYHNFSSMALVLQKINKEYPEITRLYSIGKSAQGRSLLVLLITHEPDYEPILKPNVKYIANMHGNEAVGREMLLHLASYMVSSYGDDQYVTWLLNNTRVHLMPSMNPDGFENATAGKCDGLKGRFNAYSFDLNRNFPDYFKGSQQTVQPETRAIMEWLQKTQFVLSANLQAGAIVARYPFDNINPKTFRYSSKLGYASLTPDDDVFRHLAETYSFNHKNMHLQVGPCRSGTHIFTNGTTNGADWYAFKGGMQDYNYVWGGCMEITLGISCCKYPQDDRLFTYWEENQNALLKYLGEVHRGVWGIVTDSRNNPLHNVNITVEGREFGSKTTPRGEYWRILRPGTYNLQATADGYEPAVISVDVGDGVTLQNITLYDSSTSISQSSSDATLNRSLVLSSSVTAVWPTNSVTDPSDYAERETESTEPQFNVVYSNTLTPVTNQEMNHATSLSFHSWTLTLYLLIVAPFCYYLQSFSFCVL